MKNWLLHKKKKVYLAPCRTWKYYWVCLKGTALLFFDSDEESSVTENSMPKHLLGEYFMFILKTVIEVRQFIRKLES